MSAHTPWAADLQPLITTDNSCIIALQLAPMTWYQRPWFAIHVLNYNLRKTYNNINDYNMYINFILLLPNMVFCHWNFTQRKRSSPWLTRKFVAAITKNKNKIKKKKTHLNLLPWGGFERRHLCYYFGWSSICSSYMTNGHLSQSPRKACYQLQFYTVCKLVLPESVCICKR